MKAILVLAMLIPLLLLVLIAMLYGKYRSWEEERFPVAQARSYRGHHRGRAGQPGVDLDEFLATNAP